jgi:hypothetical protein
MGAFAIRPTVTQRVRELLASQGVEVKPWAPLDDTYASLYRLMAAKRDDAEFWGPVQRLLGEIVEDAAGANGRLPAPQAELLKGWDIEDLVRDLRKALPSETAADSSAFKRFSAGLSAQVLGGFLLFGFAASGCDHVVVEDDIALDSGADGGMDSGEGVDTDVCTDTGTDGGVDSGVDGGTLPPWAQCCDLSSTSVLWAAINDATSLTDGEKADLCACFADLNQSWANGLTEIFESASPGDAAWYLEQMIACCEDPAMFEGGFPEGFTPEWCVSLYKGAAFPS